MSIYSEIECLTDEQVQKLIDYIISLEGSPADYQPVFSCPPEERHTN